MTNEELQREKDRLEGLIWGPDRRLGHENCLKQDLERLKEVNNELAKAGRESDPNKPVNGTQDRDDKGSSALTRMLGKLGLKACQTDYDERYRHAPPGFPRPRPPWPTGTGCGWGLKECKDTVEIYLSRKAT